MPNLFIFADEAGDFEFSAKGSRYFVLCTVSMYSCEVGAKLLDLRRDLTRMGVYTKDFFHCTTDPQAIRDQVFGVICNHDFHVQATIMEKAKAYLRVRISRARFYQYGWFYHFKHGAHPLINPPNGAKPHLLVTAASIGTGKERAAFLASIDDVMRQTVPGRFATHFCPAAADPCVQMADYCAWAIQRKWERDDARSYDFIKNRITYEYDLWSHGMQLHY